jgi:hypothetical protein
MSLPPAQQRALDSMAETLRASEPRLAAMFAIFTRLNRFEASPRREQLPRERRLRLRLPKIGLRSARTSGTRRPHEIWLHLLIASPLAIALVVVGLVMGLGSHPPSPGCSVLPGAHVTASHHGHDSRCPAQAGMTPGELFGK